MRRTARPSAATPRPTSARPWQRNARRSRRSARSRSTAPPCRRELPGAIYIGEPQPGNKYRIFITGDGFGTHIKLPGSIQLDPADRSDGGLVQKPAPDTAGGVQLPLLRLRQGPAGDADPLRQLRSQSRIRTVGQRSLEPVLAELVHDRLRPERDPLSGCGPSVQPDDDRRQLRQHRRRLLEPAAAGQPRRRRPEHGPHQHRDATWLLGQDRRDPVLPGVGDPGCSSRPATRASPSWRTPPARPRARSARCTRGRERERTR